MQVKESLLILLNNLFKKNDQDLKQVIKTKTKQKILAKILFF